VIALAAAALMTGSAKAGAQERPPAAPPDLRMLLNLDLFRPHADDGANGGGGPGAASNGSMVDQIRALKAMGYLGGNHNNAQTAGGTSEATGAHVAAPNPPLPETGDSSDSEGQP
jgi:hypothetical protein